MLAQASWQQFMLWAAATLSGGLIWWRFIAGHTIFSEFYAWAALLVLPLSLMMILYDYFHVAEVTEKGIREQWQIQIFGYVVWERCKCELRWEQVAKVTVEQDPFYPKDMPKTVLLVGMEGQEMRLYRGYKKFSEAMSCLANSIPASAIDEKVRILFDAEYAT